MLKQMFSQKEACERIKKARIEIGLTVEKLAEIMDLSATFMALVNRGERFCSVRNVIKLSKVLGVTTDYILVGNTESEIGADTPRQKLTTLATMLLNDDEAELLIEMFKLITRDGLNPRDYNYLLANVKSFVEYLKQRENKFDK